MKTIVGLMFFVLFSSASLTAAQDVKRSLGELTWLSGCWEMNAKDKNLVITEMWMKPAGGMMIGAGRTVRDGKAVDHEFLRIVQEGDSVFYVAKPTANTEETKFKLIKASANEIVFENPAHDFPQRVIYKLSGDRLDARVEGTMNGKLRGMDFPYTRAKCE